MKATAFATALTVALLLGLPLLGVWVAGEAPGKYMEFPPLTRYVEHAAFSWIAFWGLAAFIVVVFGTFVVRAVSAGARGRADTSRSVCRFPWWGWLALATGAGAWLVAWTRFDWLGPLQRHTFSPLWLSYVLVVNAWTWKRTGRCMLTHRTCYFLCLFPASAAFWWFFEYLNRFVQNWYYVGAEGASPAQYVAMATLPFATVLPAVTGTAELLASWSRLSAGIDRFTRLRMPRGGVMAAVVLLVAAAGLAGIGVWPDYLFPLLWVSPLLVITSLQALMGRRHLFQDAVRGDWCRIWQFGVAALICGVFWEMWNMFSHARWIYSVPFVGRFRIFEMPLLGYAGYLPFGVECLVLADLVQGIVAKQRKKRQVCTNHCVSTEMRSCWHKR